MPALLDTSIYNALKELSVLDTAVLDQAYATAQSSEGSDLYQIILQQDLVSDENLGKLIADIYNRPLIKLQSTSTDVQALQLIPEILSRTQQMVCV